MNLAWLHFSSHLHLKIRLHHYIHPHTTTHHPLPVSFFSFYLPRPVSPPLSLFFFHANNQNETRKVSPDENGWFSVSTRTYSDSYFPFHVSPQVVSCILINSLLCDSSNHWKCLRLSLEIDVQILSLVSSTLLAVSFRSCP